MRVGVLLNHYAPHQVPHVVPYAFALSRIRPEWTVEILCSTPDEMAFAEDIAHLYPDHRAKITRIGTPLHARLIDPILQKVAFYRKQAVLRGNRAVFSRFDALLVPEITSLALKSLAGCGHLRLIFTGHGAGDFYNNVIGMFDPKIAQFDLVLLQGQRIAAGLVADGRFAHVAYGIAGYVKYEIAPATAPRLFDNDRPVVLYNPTQNPRGSSWHRFGLDVLDFFAGNETYNLIFAPHALLFKRGWSRGARLPAGLRAGPRLIVDTQGTRSACDMTYTEAADLYLGDQSSQIYEFIRRPRPCVFLNPNAENWRGNPNFQSWTFGPVVEDIGDLGQALARALDDFARWRPNQEQALIGEGLPPDAPMATAPASTRGAHIIAEFLETGQVGAQWH